MHHLVFLPFPVNLDLWMKSTVRPDYGFNHYTYVLIYVDDVMVIHHDAESVLRRIDKYFKLKPSSIGDPDIYLGSKLNKIRLENGVWSWANSPAIYVKESVANVENYLSGLASARWQFLENKSENPFFGDYAPEIDKTPSLEQELVSLYKSFLVFQV